MVPIDESLSEFGVIASTGAGRHGDAIVLTDREIGVHGGEVRIGRTNTQGAVVDRIQLNQTTIGVKSTRRARGTVLRMHNPRARNDQ